MSISYTEQVTERSWRFTLYRISNVIKCHCLRGAMYARCAGIIERKLPNELTKKSFFSLKKQKKQKKTWWLLRLHSVQNSKLPIDFSSGVQRLKMRQERADCFCCIYFRVTALHDVNQFIIAVKRCDPRSIAIKQSQITYVAIEQLIKSLFFSLYLDSISEKKK